MKKELLEQYKKQAEKSPRNMEKCIKKHLEEIAAASPAFAAKYDEKRFKCCISFVYSCAREILKSKHGEVADDICYKMARDYFEEELWKEETAPAKSEAEETEETETEEKKVCSNCGSTTFDIYKGNLCRECYEEKEEVAEAENFFKEQEKITGENVQDNCKFYKDAEEKLAKEKLAKEKPAEAPKPEKPKKEKKAPANNQDSQLDLFGGSLA